MKKRNMALFLSAVMTMGAITACGSGGGGSSETAPSVDPSANPEDISGKVVFVSGNDTTGGVDEMIAAFNEKYPNIEVEKQVLPGASDDVKKSLMTSLAAGDSEPDVFECDIIWISQFAAAGWLLDVTDNLEAKSDEYLSGPLSTCYYDGKAYAYPNYTDVGLLYYRSDLVETPPTTWDELVSMSQEHIGSDGIEYGYVFQAFQGEPISCNMLEFIKQNGGTDYEDGQFAMNNENTIGALEFVKGLIDDGIAPESVLAAKPDDSKAIFEEGKALFMRNWTYAYQSAQADTSKVAGNVGVAPLPVGPNGTESSGTLGGWNYAINKNSENKEAAILFAEFMSSYDAQKISTLVRGTFPTNAAVYEDADVLEALPFLSDIQPAVDAAKPRPQVRDYATISSIFAVNFQRALTGESSFEDAMAQMDSELNSALEKMQ